MFHSLRFFVFTSCVCFSAVIFQVTTSCHANEDTVNSLPASSGFLRNNRRTGRQLQSATTQFMDYDFTGPISTDGPSTLLFESNTGEDATLLSQQAYTGTIDLELEYTEREFCGNANGWQTAAVLFFAPDDTTLEVVTTRDNNFATFEANTVASIKDKLYPAIDASYFDKRVIDYATGENVGLRQSLVQPGQMTAGSNSGSFETQKVGW